ncbi:MAG: NADPH-dependent F420 reductase [Acidimicrobiales bacterium]
MQKSRDFSSTRSADERTSDNDEPGHTRDAARRRRVTPPDNANLAPPLEAASVRIGIVGAGHIGSNCARLFTRAGHRVLLSYSRTPERLTGLAHELGNRAAVVSPREAVVDADLTVIAVPWLTIDDAIAQVGSFDGRIVIDTSNQFGTTGTITLASTAARHNAQRMTDARYTKSFNTLTAAFQAEASNRTGDDRVVQWVCGDDGPAKRTVMELIDDIGYVAVDVGGLDDAAVMEAPRRAGAVYGEEYRLPDARNVVAALRQRTPIPPTPSYATSR